MSNDAAAIQAKADLVTAYDNAAGRTPTTSFSAELGGQTLLDGVYAATAEGPLDGERDPDAGW